MAASQVIRMVRTPKPLVALTFDDGPHARFTAEKVQYLRAYRARATFFVLGQVASGQEETLAVIRASGNEVASHGYAHPNLARLGGAGIRNDLSRAQAVIGQHRLFRPPYGAFTAQVLAIAGELGYAYTCLWNVDPRDWTRPQPSVIVARVLSVVAPGAIVVMHDQFQPTVQALPGILDGLAACGLSAVTLSELLTAAGT